MHVHIYDQDNEHNLVAEMDLELIESYEDYDQYGFERNGEWIEIRVPR